MTRTSAADKNELALLNDLVQPVVRTDSSHTEFKIWEAKGHEQLEASRVFDERLPRYLADLMGRDDDVSALDATATEVERRLRQRRCSTRPGRRQGVGREADRRRQEGAPRAHRKELGRSQRLALR